VSRKIACAVCFLGLMAAAAVAAPPKPEQGLPDTTLVCVVYRGGQDFKKSLEGTALGRIYNEPGVKAFVEAVVGALTRLDPKGFSWLADGDFAIGLDSNPAADPSVQVMLITNAPGAVEKLAVRMQELSPAPAAKAKIKGESADVYNLAIQGKNIEVALVRRGTLTFAGEKAMIAKSFDILSGQRANIVVTPGYRAAAAALDREEAAFLYLNIPRAIQLLKSNAMAAQTLNSDAARAFGLSSMQGLMVGFWADPPGIGDMGMLVLTGPGGEMLRALCGKEADRAFFEYVPADAVGCSIAKVDPGGAFDVLTAKLSVNPETQGEFEMAMEQLRAVLGFDLRKDLLGAITGEFIMYNYFPEQISMTDPGRFTCLIGTRDKAKMASIMLLLAQLASPAPGPAAPSAPNPMRMMMAQMLKAEQVSVGGREAWKFTVPLNPMTGQMLTLWLSVDSPWSIISSSKQDIEAAMAGKPARPITEVEDFKTVFKKLPAGGCWAGYADYRSAFTAYYKMMPQFLSALPAASAMPPLPDEKLIARHMFPGAQVALLKKDGLEIRYWTPMGLMGQMAGGMAAGFATSRKLLRTLPGAGPMAGLAAPVMPGQQMAPPARIPIGPKQRDMAHKRPLSDSEKLANLGVALMLYQAKNNGRLPDRLGQLADCVSRVDAFGEPGEIVMPHPNRLWPTRSLSDVVLVYGAGKDKEGKRLVLFADGGLRKIKADELQAVLAKSASLMAK